MDDDFRKAALDYHRLPRPGKLSVEPTKRMATQRDLGLFPLVAERYSHMPNNRMNCSNQPNNEGD